MNNVYNINWSRFVNDLLLISIRKPFLKALLRCLVGPIKQAHENFLAYRKEALYRVRHNSQIAYMEAVLNDSFDSVYNRIKIKNVQLKEAIYFYEPEENKEVYFYEPEDNEPVYFYEDDDLAGEGVDFVVMVPPDLHPLNPNDELALLTHIKAQIDYYKLYSKNYKIIWGLAEN